MAYTTISDTELLKLGHQHKLKNYSVIAIDEVPSVIKANSCGIINLQERWKGGTHWVAYYVRPKHVYFFDSFGVAVDPRILKFLKSGKANRQVQTNIGQIQEIQATSCGMWCLKFLLHVRDGGDLISWIANFNTNNQQKNEKLLEKK